MLLSRASCWQSEAALIGRAVAQAAWLAPPNDAADVGASLTRLGFSVRRIENTGFGAMRRVLLEFGRQARDAETRSCSSPATGTEVGKDWFLPNDAGLKTDADVEKGAAQRDGHGRSRCRDWPHNAGFQPQRSVPCGDSGAVCDKWETFAGRPRMLRLTCSGDEGPLYCIAWASLAPYAASACRSDCLQTACRPSTRSRASRLRGCFVHRVGRLGVDRHNRGSTR